jgi:hypothetical protein
VERGWNEIPWWINILAVVLENIYKACVDVVYTSFWSVRASTMTRPPPQVEC